MTAMYEQGDLLAQVVHDAPHDADIITDVIHADALAHGGEVNTNRVREHLQSQHPGVRPAVIGGVYHSLCARGRLERIAEIRSTDLKSRNRNKAASVYRWVGAR